MHKAIQNALRPSVRRSMSDWQHQRRVIADTADRHEHQGRTIEAHATRSQVAALDSSMERMKP